MSPKWGKADRDHLRVPEIGTFEAQGDMTCGPSYLRVMKRKGARILGGDQGWEDMGARNRIQGKVVS